MFQSARVKLTFWYLLIIMTVSISFSAIIYRGVSIELERRLSVIQSRLELRRYVLFPDQPDNIGTFIDDLQDSRQRVVIILIYTNAVILILSSMAGYFLAGKTLQPIEQALEDQKRFVADASHEFKTPLTSLQTSIEVALRDKKMDLKEAKNVLKESLNDIESLGTLSNYLLGLARFQRDNNFPKEKIQLNELVSKCIKKVMPLAYKRKIKIEFSGNPVFLKANAESLEKVLTILLDNAIKYSDKNKKIEVTVKKSARNAVIIIRDQGIGISAKDLPHIFERFYRADASRSKEDVAGFGLGLSMAKQIVDLHNGEIKAESIPGKGSAFTVKLPS